MCLHVRPYFSVSSFYTHSYNLARTLPQRDTPSFVAAGGNGQGKAELEGQGALRGSVPSSRQVFPKEEAEPSSGFIVGRSRQSGRVQDRIISTMVNATPQQEDKSRVLLFSCKKGTQAAFSLHSTFPELQENKALATFWKDITEGEIRIITIAII